MTPLGILHLGITIGVLMVTDSKCPPQPRGRDAGTGGGAVRVTCPLPNLKAVGAPTTQLWTVNVVHFYFCLFLHVNLCPSQK